MMELMVLKEYLGKGCNLLDVALGNNLQRMIYEDGSKYIVIVYCYYNNCNS